MLFVVVVIDIVVVVVFVVVVVLIMIVPICRAAIPRCRCEPHRQTELASTRGLSLLPCPPVRSILYHTILKLIV